MTVPILSFEPIYKSVVWGGDRLASVLGRELPGDDPIGESWEVVDLPGDQSTVRGGPWDGEILGDLCAQRSAELLGAAPPLAGRFPLLLKFIDARRTLSVQVHPDEAASARLGGGARPKTEAWYIIDRDPGAALYVGLEPGVDRAVLERAIDRGEVAETLHRVPVEPGDFVFLPAGTVHAIGAGIVLAEVQQSSATTYRVFDWNRVGLDGRPRELHVAEALEATDYSRVGAPRAPSPASGRDGVACRFFSMELVPAGEGAVLGADGPLALMGLGGTGRRDVAAGDATASLDAGRTLLVPAAAAGEVRLEPGPLGVLATRVGGE